MNIDLDFTGVEAPSFNPVPEDDYVLVLSDFQLKPSSKENGNIVAHCVYEITEGDFAGRKLFDYRVVTGPNVTAEQKGYIKVWLEALMDTDLDGPISLDAEDLVGTVVSAHVEQVPDNRDSSKIQNKIKYFIRG